MGLPVTSWPPASVERFSAFQQTRKPTDYEPLDLDTSERVLTPNPEPTLDAEKSQQSSTGSDLTEESFLDGEWKETSNWDDVDYESISSTRPQYHGTLGYQKQTMTMPCYTFLEKTIDHPEFIHGLDLPNSPPLTQVLGSHDYFNDHDIVSRQSNTLNYLPDPCDGYYLIDDLERVAVQEYNVTVCQSIMKTTSQLFPKELPRGLLSFDEANIWMSMRSQLMNLVQNISDAVRGLEPSVPFQILQNLSDFLQEQYLDLLDPRQNYEQDLRFFYHANEKLKATLVSLQSWLPSLSPPSYATIVPGNIINHDESCLLPKDRHLGSEHNHTSDLAEHISVSQNWSGSVHSSLNHSRKEPHPDTVDPVPLPPLNTVNYDVASGHMGFFDRPANYRSDLHAGGSQTSALDVLRGTLPAKHTACFAGKLGVTRESKFKGFYKRLGRLFLPPNHPWREAEPRNHTSDLRKDSAGLQAPSPLPIGSYPDSGRAESRHFDMDRATNISVENPPTESRFFKKGKAIYSSGETDESRKGDPVSPTGRFFKVPFRNHDPDVL